MEAKKIIRNLWITVIILIGVLMLSQQCSAQRGNVFVSQSPGSYDDGFSFGVQYEHQNDIIYVGPEVYYFPQLNDMDYVHLIGRFGLNVLRLGDLRFYAGGRAGLIGRDWEFPYALLGAEAGFDWYIEEFDIIVGLSTSTDMKNDSKRWGVDSHTVNSGFFRIGKRW